MGDSFVESYFESLNRIDKIYKKRYGENYAEDGIICEGPKTIKDYFEGPSPRIVLCLKECHDNGIWKPREVGTIHYEKENGSKIWARYIVKEIAFLRSGSIEKSPETHPGVSGFAYINLKKNDRGKKRTSKRELLAAVEKDSDLLLDQIQSLHPELLFCCGRGVYEGFQHIFSKLATSEEIICQLVADRNSFLHCFQFEDFHDVKQNVLVIENWPHPSQNNWGYARLYEGLNRLVKTCQSSSISNFIERPLFPWASDFSPL